MTNQATITYPAWPYFEKNDIDAVGAVLQSGKVNYWTGTTCRTFEKRFASYCGVNYAIAVANGTVALELALVGLGIGAGDEVIVPCRTFIATASSVVMCGATPVVADVDAFSQNVTLASLLRHISPRTRALVVVHHAGWPVEITPIAQFCRDNGIALIEDCAQAHGAMFENQRVGSFGDVAAFSFCQDKIMTTGGEGGMVVTNDETLWSRMWAHKEHGKDYNTVFNQQHPPGFRWLHHRFGTNWRMTEMQAAIGLAQLARLDDWLVIRRENAACLDAGLAEVPGIETHTPDASRMKAAYYKYYAFIANAQHRDSVQRAISARGVPCFVGTCANITREKAFQTLGQLAPQSMPISEKLSRHALQLLVHPGCTRALMHAVVEVVAEAVQQVTCRHV